MKRKIVEGPIRSKEKSKQKLLNAVGKLLKTKGYTGLKVNDIAATAGLDKN
ncbi:TetR/AcrR family transcriptional regulator [Niabella sp. W65]|nr:TetR/AcrR family transcriptional regulator [Niabella sp. W65]MCH7364235.1 TetR/AcrR family transcriptional regulator [Niabella sp. W65]